MCLEDQKVFIYLEVFKLFRKASASFNPTIDIFLESVGILRICCTVSNTNLGFYKIEKRNRFGINGKRSRMLGVYGGLAVILACIQETGSNGHTCSKTRNSARISR